MSIINSAHPDYNQNNQHTTIIKAKISSLGKMIQKWEYVEMKEEKTYLCQNTTITCTSSDHDEKKLARFRNSSIKGVT